MRPSEPEMSRRTMALAIFILIVVGVSARLLPHIPNFAPITATALFCGAYMPRRVSLVALLAVMLASDYLLLYINPYGSIGFDQLYAPQALWHSSLPYIYAAFGISAVVGWLVARDRSPGFVVAAAMFCSVQFFLITNAAVWIEGIYDRGLSGLWQAYAAGLPFYRGTLLGDLFYTTAFFSLYELARRRSATGATELRPV